MTTQTYWTDSIRYLFSGSQCKNWETFDNSMEILYEHLRDNHEGRCRSKKIHIEDERKEMIKKLFKQYCQGATSHELCQSRYMRKLAKHDRVNDSILHYIDLVVDLQLKNFQLEALQNDLEVKLWLRNYNICVSNPEKLVSYCELHLGLSTEFLEILSAESKKLDKMLIDALNQGWLTESKVEEVIDLIENEKWYELETRCVDFTEQSIVHCVAFRYYLLIKSGLEFADKFKKIILINLRFFINKG